MGVPGKWSLSPKVRDDGPEAAAYGKPFLFADLVTPQLKQSDKKPKVLWH